MSVVKFGKINGTIAGGLSPSCAEGDMVRIISAGKNSYASKVKKPVSMRLSEDVVEYFKGMADKAGVRYQSLINLYLRDCLAQNCRVQIKWPSACATSLVVHASAKSQWCQRDQTKGVLWACAARVDDLLIVPTWRNRFH